MTGKKQRKSRRRKMLEKDSEEKLMQRIAKIKMMLSQEESDERYYFTDSSNEENSEPERNKRTRLGSPYPTARSLSPDVKDYDHNEADQYSNQRNQSGNRGNWESQPFYCLPVKTTHQSTSGGYSDSLATSFYSRRDTRKDPDQFKNPRRSTERNLPAETSNETWVPLTFLDPSKETFVNPPSDPKSISRPKLPDLRRRATVIEKPVEEDIFESREIKTKSEKRQMRQTKIEQSKKATTSTGSSYGFRSENSETKFFEFCKEEMKIENSLEIKIKRSKRSTTSRGSISSLRSENSENEFFDFWKKEMKIESSPERNIERYKRSTTSRGSISSLNSENSENEFFEFWKEEMKIDNSPEAIEKKDTDSYKRYSVDAMESPQKELMIINSVSEPKISEPEVLKSAQQKTKVQNSLKTIQKSDTDSCKVLGKMPKNLLFDKCVSIAAEIPEEALLSLRNLQIPKLEVKVEETEVITIDDEDFENSAPVSRKRSIGTVEANSIETTESLPNKEKLFETVVKSMIEEKLKEDEEKSRKNLRKSSMEKSEKVIKEKIDFGEEMEKFLAKLKIIKNLEEKMKDF